MKLKTIAILTFLLSLATLHAGDLDNFILSLNRVEASGKKINIADGDRGRSIGPLQIMYAYWKDATEFDKTIGGTYQDCRNYDYAAKVVKAYLRRYGNDLIQRKDWSSLARLHNAGPEWRKKKRLTDRYVVRVKQALKKIEG